MTRYKTAQEKKCINVKYIMRIGRFINHACADTVEFRRLHRPINITPIYANLEYVIFTHHLHDPIVYFKTACDIAAFEELP